MPREEEVMKDNDQKMNWRVIPVVVFLFLVVIPLATFWVGKLTDFVLGLPLFPPFPFNLIIGVSVLFSGAVFCWGSMYQLYRTGQGMPWGDVDDAAQSTALVTTGFYGYTRNPMILGFLLVLSGIGWLWQSITAILIIPLIGFGVLWAWLKRREEPKLEQRFGDAYRTYRKTTPLIIPRPWKRIKKHQKKKEGGGPPP